MGQFEFLHNNIIKMKKIKKYKIILFNKVFIIMIILVNNHEKLTIFYDFINNLYVL